MPKKNPASKNASGGPQGQDLADSSMETVPRHVAIIMDGNGRWAKERSKPRIYGHQKGERAVKNAIKAAEELGVKYLTLYAFSSENWSRPKEEVEALMTLLIGAIKRYEKDLIKNKVRFRTIGNLSALPKKALDSVNRLKKLTEGFTDGHLILALNYGSRDEILRAAKAFASDVKAGRADPEKLDWDSFSAYLDTADIPDPDLLIRTSGELRLSNFLMAQSAYTELYFTKVYWPDFTKEEFKNAVAEYSRRERRYGKTAEQMK